MLRLTPRQLRELTPGEYGDMMESRIWALGGNQDQAPREMTPEERQDKLRQLRERERHGQHR